MKDRLALRSFLVALLVGACGGVRYEPPSRQDAGVAPEADGGTSDAGISGEADGGADAGRPGWPRPACGDPNPPVGPTPPPRSDTSGALSADARSLVIFGGNTAVPVCGQPPAQQHAGDTWVLDVTCGTWTQATAAPAPAARARHSLVLDAARERVLLFGGRSRQGSSGPYTLYNDVWAFDLRAKSWSAISTSGTAPAARGNSAIVVLRNELFVFGGNTSTSGLSFSPQNDTYSLNLETGAWRAVSASGTVPPRRLFHAAAADPEGKRIYVYAGGDANAFQGPFLKDLWVLDVGAERWHTVPLARSTSEVGRIKHGLVFRPPASGVSTTQMLYLFAGHDDGALGNRNDVARLDLGASTSLPFTEPRAWTSVKPGDTLNASPTGQCSFPGDFVIPETDSPERRSAFVFAATADGGAFVAFGGASDCGLLADTWWFDTATGAWTPIRKVNTGLTCKRKGFSDCPVLCG